MRYVYGMRARGFSLGCQPKADFIERLDDTSDTFYDILVYGRKLSCREVADYELEYLGEVADENAGDSDG
jgi:hypothetical protein